MRSTALITLIKRLTGSNRRFKSAFEFWKVWYVKKAKILGTAFCAQAVR